MIYISAEARTAFAVWNGKTATCHETIALPGCDRTPPLSARNNLLTHRVVVFPSQPMNYGCLSELLAEVRRVIHRYADLSEGFEDVATYYVLLSWVYDAFNELPYLRLKGDFGTGKSRCLLTVGSLCYKPMFASGASTVSPLFRIIDTFRGTLVMDEGDCRYSDERAELVKILNNGNAAGFPVLRSEVTPTKEYNPRAFVVFGPKVIATRASFDDNALESRCITEVMTGLPPRADIPLSLPDTFHAEATASRDQLLVYRFTMLGFFRGRSVPVIADCEPRIAQVYAPLLAIIEDEAARERVEGLAREASKRLRAERSASVEAQLLDVIRELLNEGETLSVKSIADRFADRFSTDYTRPITPRWIGAQLRNRLSLIPIKSHGIFILPPESLPRLKSLFARYGVGDGGDIGDVPA